MRNEKTGEVFPLRYTGIQVFARKVISPLGDKVTKEDIEREATAISVLSKAGRNKNVVTILRHDWLRNRPGIYYIDMECCSTTLHDKIHDGAKILTENVEVRQDPARYGPTVQLGEQPFLGVEPHYAQSRTYKPINSSSLDLTVDWEAVLNIIQDIVSGLIYIHDQNTVHRDLKSRNGILNPC
jgi:serine/threonine protein kinase